MNFFFFSFTDNKKDGHAGRMQASQQQGNQNKNIFMSGGVGR